MLYCLFLIKLNTFYYLGGKPISKRLHKTSVLSIFPWTKKKQVVNSKSSFNAENSNAVECFTHEKQTYS